MSIPSNQCEAINHMFPAGNTLAALQMARTDPLVAVWAALNAARLTSENREVIVEGIGQVFDMSMLNAEQSKAAHEISRLVDTVLRAWTEPSHHNFVNRLAALAALGFSGLKVFGVTNPATHYTDWKRAITDKDYW